MYNEKMAAAIKSNGKILREFKDKVYLKFGSEYSIFIKNLNTVRALVNVYIDGTNVTPGGLVVNANSEVDLERSLANNNLNVGNKFKFIERTDDIEQHRGIKLEDGIVKIEYQFEKIITNPVQIVNQWPFYNPGGTGIIGGNVVTTPLIQNASLQNASYDALRGIPISANATFSANATSVQTYNDAGITVPGSKSEQKFINVASFAVDPTKYCMVFNLLGETPDNKPVIKTVTVKHKQKCISCGSQNKAHAKFCNKCGTALEIFS